MADNSKPTCLPQWKGFATDCIHAAQPPDEKTGAVIPTLSLSTTFVQPSPGINKGFEYSRTGNPTRNSFEACMAKLEAAKYGVAFSSGSAATATLMSLLKTGDHCISIDDVYGGTQRYFRKVAGPQHGVLFTFVDFTKEGAFEAAIQPNTKMVWIETPTNPTLKITDIALVSKIAHQHNLIVVVDNTFLSPYFQRPLTLGADIVVHSITKYINGHTDVVGGVVCLNSDDIYHRLKFLQNSLGAIPAPFDCFQALRGIKTLPLRMQQHEKNAFMVAHWLEKHPKVERVIYPGLKSHPQHEIARKQQSGFGGMITIYLKGGLNQSREFLEHLHLFAMAESLGGVDSLAEHPAIMTHASVPAEERAKLGISDSLCRLSIGLEDIDDIIADLESALNHVKL